jgi:hypothetical protein
MQRERRIQTLESRSTLQLPSIAARTAGQSIDELDAAWPKDGIGTWPALQASQETSAPQRKQAKQMPCKTGAT